MRRAPSRFVSVDCSCAPLHLAVGCDLEPPAGPTSTVPTVPSGGEPTPVAQASVSSWCALKGGSTHVSSPVEPSFFHLMFTAQNFGDLMFFPLPVTLGFSSVVTGLIVSGGAKVWLSALCTCSSDLGGCIPHDEPQRRLSPPPGAVRCNGRLGARSATMSVCEVLA